MNELPTDLMRAEAFPPPAPSSVELRETHVSWVFLTEGEAFKVKKPVRYDFLDFGTPDARRRACEDEVVLNQRLATGVYRGVVPVRRGSDGRLTFVGEGPVVDWAVRMLRLPDAMRADVRLAAGSLTAADLDAVASHVADFHARVRADAPVAAWGMPEAIARSVTENFAEVNAASVGLLTEKQEREVEEFQRGFLENRHALFERRVAEGRVREGHGDLRLEHVYLDERGDITILDCIEFSDRFRCGDVAADIAFLSMDLAAKGRVDLAERVLAKYARASNDYEIYALVDFYESYRAYVRGKVSTLLAQGAEGDLRARAEADARRHFTLALAMHRRSLLGPVVVAVGGIIASGKSTVADAIADHLSAPVVDADRTRKHLLGLAPTAFAGTGAAFEGAYDPEFTQKVYAEMLHRASYAIESGRPVVLDASFRSAEMRRAARELAEEHGVPFVMIECRATEETCRARLAEREKRTNVSDGRAAVFDAFVARVEPMSELPHSQHVVVDTNRPLEQTIAEIERRVRTWPTGLVG